LSAEALRVVLDVADSVIVPIETEPLSFDPTARTAKSGY
jgi:chromosome partitioning protein